MAHPQASEIRAPTYDIVAVGDVMLGRLVGQELEVRQTSPWIKVSNFFPAAHLQIGNFESAVAGDGLRCVRPGELCLTVAPSRLGLLGQAGFTHMGLANNHAADLGADGKQNTHAQLLASGVEPLDADRNISFANAGGLRVALVAISLVPDALGNAVRVPSVALAQKMALARALADRVVVTVHWGNELQPWASQQQRDAAQWLVAQGADLIFGHHPHVVQAAECVEGRPVWFSLGNHVFDQKYAPTHTGAMAACRFSRDSGDAVCDAYRTARTAESAVLEHLGVDAEHPQLRCSPTATRHGGRMDLTAVAGGAPGTYDLFAGRAVSPDKVVTMGLPLRKLMGMELKGGDAALVMLLELESPFDQVKGLRPHVYRQTQGRLLPLWRGSALAYPVDDVRVQQDASGKDVLCVLHSPVSHLGRVRVSTADHIVLAYRWTGFGFNADPSTELTSACTSSFGL